MQFYDDKTSLAEKREYECSFTGTGAANPTKRYGQGITFTRTASGVYRATFAEHPGAFVKIGGYAFGADTPSAVKGYTLTRGVFVAPTSSALGYLEMSVWNSSFAAADLAALQYLDVTLVFAASAVAQ